jgi:hypothetical protein
LGIIFLCCTNSGGDTRDAEAMAMQLVLGAVLAAAGARLIPPVPIA